MIRASYRPDPLARRARSWLQAWEPGATVRSFAPRASVPLACWRNGGRVAAERWDDQLLDGDFLEYAPEPGDPASVSATVVFFGASHTFTGAAAIAVAAAALVAQAIAARFLIQALVGSPRKPSGPGDVDSTHYGFGGIQSNPAYSGAALPVVFGRHRVAGVIVNIYTRTISVPNTTDLYMLIALADHQVQAIGDKTADGGPFTTAAGDLPTGLQIDGQPATNFLGVECYVRMGSENQTAIPGFEQARLQFSVGSTLTVPASPSTVVATPGSYGQSHAEITKWDTEVAYTAGDESDSFVAQLFFPQGLFTLDTTSAKTLPYTVEFQARYIEVDGGGTPIGNYAVLPKTTISAAVRTPFYHEIEAAFVDPATYTAPVGSSHLSLDGTNDYARNAAAVGIPTSAPLTTQTTFLAWVRVSWATTTGGAFSGNLNFTKSGRQYIVSQFGTNQGFAFYIEKGSSQPVTINGTTYSSHTVNIGVKHGNGTSTNTTVFNSTNLAGFLAPTVAPAVPLTNILGPWAMLTATYQANVDAAGNGEFVFYCNTTRIGTVKVGSGTRPIWSPTSEIIVGAENTTPSNVFAGVVDEVLGYQRTLSSPDVSAKWNGGAPAAPTSASEIGLVFGYHLDSNGNDFVKTNHLTLTNGAAIVATSGTAPQPVIASPVPSGTSGTPKRSRYKVELQRITGNPSSSNGLTQDEIQWAAIQLVDFQVFQYPSTALLAVKIRASEQLNTNQPLVTQLVDGAPCIQWDGVDPQFPTLTRVWTQNPVWILAQAATDHDYGLGQFFPTSSIDWPAFKAAADFCDELVYDQRSTPNLITAQALTAATAGAADWPNGQIWVRFAEATYPVGWPTITAPAGTVTPAASAAHWIQIIDVALASGPPAWIQTHDDTSLAVGEVIFDVASSRYELRLHPVTAVSADVSAYSPPANTVKGKRYEKRMQFDGVFDRTDQSAWEALGIIAQSARMVTILRGSVLSLFFDGARSPNALVTMANIVEGSFRETFSGLADRPNHEVAEFNDRDLNYEQDEDEDEHADVNAPTRTDGFRSRRISLIGVTRRSQVKRHMRQDLNSFHLLRRTCEFECGPDALGMEPGDLILVSHDLPQWGYSGRIIQHSPNTLTLFLDREVTMDPGVEYAVVVRDSASGTIETRDVNEVSTGNFVPVGTPVVITSSVPFTFMPRIGDVYAFGRKTATTEEFTVVSTELDPKTLVRRVKCLEYDANVYSFDFGALPTTQISALPPVTNNGVPIAPLMISGGDATYRTSDGTIIAAIEVGWGWDTGAVAQEGDRVEVWIAEHDGSGLRRVALAPASDRTVRVTDGVQVEKSYLVYVQPVRRDGKRLGLFACPSVRVGVLGDFRAMAAPTSVSADMTGMALRISWDPASVRGARAVEVRVGGWILGQVVGVAPASQGELLSPHWSGGPANDYGAQDAPFYLRAVDGLGRYGDAALVRLTPQVRGQTNDYQTSREDAAVNWA